MGMGEPMMNLDNVLAACRRLPDLGITNRRTAISTVGWIPGIEQLAEDPMPIRLALSLHAADQALRSELMPVNDRYPLPDVIAACEAYYERKRRKVFIEYVMLAGVNDSHVQADPARRGARPAGVQGQPDPVQPDRPRHIEGRARRRSRRSGRKLERRGLDATVRLTRGPRDRRCVWPARGAGRA